MWRDIADRCHLPAGAHTRSEIVSQLASRHVDESLIADIDDLLGHCERSRYAGDTPEDASDAAHQARDLIARLEKESFA